jgi:predicted AAA+ superfamily ATPase
LLLRELEARKGLSWVLIDEVQRVPELLNVVHYHLEKSGTDLKFALTGSSARKLRRGASNLLAGRAFNYALFPLTHFELEGDFNLGTYLRFGGLPRVYALASEAEKIKFLETYALTYIQEEIWNEHLIRDLPPFRKFLQVAAQMNGEVLNYSKIAVDVGADDKTVKEYFNILEDTLVATLLEPYDRSVRKRQSTGSKCYFFDVGVKRAIEGSVGNKIVPGSSEYGRIFEHFLMNEIFRMNSYRQLNAQFSYLRTKDGAEVDLVIERKGMPTTLVEIKSTDRVSEGDAKTLQAFLPSFPKAQAMVLSNDSKEQKFGQVLALPWQVGLQRLVDQ